MNLTLFAVLSLALLLAIVALVREVRLRRAVEAILRSILARLWRNDAHEKPVSDDARAPDRPDDRLCR